MTDDAVTSTRLGAWLNVHGQRLSVQSDGLTNFSEMSGMDSGDDVDRGTAGDGRGKARVRKRRAAHS